ncbi:hypothetical protein DL768_006941 [Monosporascus sp. mg162]|nr:hypothetical protein DL768_006941 [Monosporascus sp. mg162]
MESIMELRDEQAKHLPDRSALGFANFSSQDSKQGLNWTRLRFIASAFFPERHSSVTGANVMDSVEHACEKSSVPVRHFLPFPDVPQLLASGGDGVRLLQSMDLVGMDGAALPAAVGDELVARDIRLVSRMGSADADI